MNEQMGGLSFLQKLTGRTSNEEIKKAAIKEAEQIIKLKQENEDLQKQLVKAAADMNRVNAELQKAAGKVCPPCPPLDLSKVQLKDIPNVGDKFKIWLKTLPSTTQDRQKIVD
jgi:hypothetical protein